MKREGEREETTENVESTECRGGGEGVEREGPGDREEETGKEGNGEEAMGNCKGGKGGRVACLLEEQA